MSEAVRITKVHLERLEGADDGAHFVLYVWREGDASGLGRVQTVRCKNREEAGREAGRALKRMLRGAFMEYTIGRHAPAQA